MGTALAGVAGFGAARQRRRAVAQARRQEKTFGCLQQLAENTHPHCTAIVQAAHIELLEGVATNSTLEFVYDGPAELAD